MRAASIHRAGGSSVWATGLVFYLWAEARTLGSQVSEPRIVALIPARAGSQRVPGKNVRQLNGHPLLAYAIGAAQEAGIFETIWVSSDGEPARDLAHSYGAFCVERPSEYAANDSPDIEWLGHLFTKTYMQKYAAFAIIRPTSPFRRGPWIAKAWDILQGCPRADSIRAVRPCGEHPAKMWRDTPQLERAYHPFLSPVMTGIGYEAPWHSMPTQCLPTVYTQTAALEIAWTRVLPGSISGQMVLPYYTERDAPEALDINEPGDWARAEQMAREHPTWLPPVTVR